MRNATAVWHRDKLYVGGHTIKTDGDDARLYIYTPTTDKWDQPVDTPVWSFGLTTYCSQLVLVGGRECDGLNHGSITNEVWTLTRDSWHGEGDPWQETLPPMETKRHSVCAVSYRDHLLVAGGWTSEGSSNVVEVFNGSLWSFAQPLPVRQSVLKSAILDQHWYLMGGEGELFVQNNAVHYTSLDALISSCRPSETSQPSSIWKRLTDVPYQYSSTAVFGSRLIAVGGERLCSPTSTVYAYSFLTNSWICVGDMQFGISCTCSVVLPTGELMIIGGMFGVFLSANIIKITFEGMLWLCIYYNYVIAIGTAIIETSYDPDSQFTASALSRLEGLGIPVITSLNMNTQRLRDVLGTFINVRSSNDTAVLNAWLVHGSSCLLPTWRNLLKIIRLLKLDELAQQINTYLMDREEQHSALAESICEDAELLTAEEESEAESISEGELLSDENEQLKSLKKELETGESQSIDIRGGKRDRKRPYIINNNNNTFR